jgi:RNA polymerase sigma factor (sigma-70 family)
MIRSREVEANREPAPDEEPIPPSNPRGPTLDRKAWDEAFRTHQHHVVISLVAAGVRPDRAVDLAQATWTRLMEQDRAGKLAEVRLPGIALAQARLLALEERRREVRRRGTSLADDDEMESSAADPEQHALDREQIDRALAVVAAAAPTAQRVFRLVYGEPPVDYERAASEVGLSLQRVRQILCELRAKIRDALDGDVERGGR